ncbi:multiheme c-type cytochrome [uncultured Algibacter sp.]
MYYLGDQKCKECHNPEFKLWQGSHHDKVMQTVSDSFVLGGFNNTKYKS